jgi:putative redox protein
VNTVFGPTELLVSSVVGCSGGVLRNILEKKRVTYNDIKVKVDVTMNEEAKVKKIDKILINFIFSGKNLDEKTIKDSVELTPKYCPMVQSIKDSIQVEETYEIGS